MYEIPFEKEEPIRMQRFVFGRRGFAYSKDKGTGHFYKPEWNNSEGVAGFYKVHDE